MNTEYRRPVTTPVNYFGELGAALDAAIGRATQEGAEFDSEELTRFLDGYNGGIKYGETRRETLPLFKLNGKLQYTRALTVVIYRMETGRYELTSYIG